MATCSYAGSLISADQPNHFVTVFHDVGCLLKDIVVGRNPENEPCVIGELEKIRRYRDAPHSLRGLGSEHQISIFEPRAVFQKPWIDRGMWNRTSVTDQNCLQLVQCKVSGRVIENVSRKDLQVSSDSAAAVLENWSEGPIFFGRIAVSEPVTGFNFKFSDGDKWKLTCLTGFKCIAKSLVGSVQSPFLQEADENQSGCAHDQQKLNYKVWFDNSIPKFISFALLIFAALFFSATLVFLFVRHWL